MGKRIREYLIYIGWVFSIIFAAAYIVLLVIMIFGFKANLQGTASLLMSALGALFTFAITMSLTYQGVLFAKDLPENKIVMSEYTTLINREKTKRKKHLATINEFMIVSAVKNLLIKGGGIFISTYALVNIVIVGIDDTMVLWLGLVNILMGLGFGMLALVKSYDTYVESHIPAIKAKIEQIKEENLCQK